MKREGPTSVLHVTQPVVEGVARLVIDLTRAQMAYGWRVHVACPGSSWLATQVLQAGALHHPWPARRSPTRGLPHEARVLREVVRAVDPDLVHLHSSKAGLVGRLVIRGRRPTLFQPHAWSFLHGGPFTRMAAAMWERAAARWVAVVVCGSDAERGIAAERGVFAPTVVVTNAVDVARYTDIGADRRRARQRLQLADAPTVLCVGRLTAQKGQDVLLRAWPAVQSRVPRAALVIVGDGPDRARLDQSALRCYRAASTRTTT